MRWYTRASLVEVVGPAIGTLQALVIEHEPLDDVLLELVGGPLPKSNGGGAADPESQGDHHVEVVVRDVVSLVVRTSCSEEPNNCFLGQLSVVEDVFDVFADRPLGLAEQLRELALVQPDRLTFETDVELGVTVLAAVKDYLAGRIFLF